MYTPTFVCEHCGKRNSATIHPGGASGHFSECDCEESRKAWEREHRAKMERRKRRRR